MVGAIPIVMWTPSLREVMDNLPVLIVRSWGEVTKSYLEEHHNKIMHQVKIGELCS